MDCHKVIKSFAIVVDKYGHGVTHTFKVTVKYSFPQWLIVIFLFGWIWY